MINTLKSTIHTHIHGFYSGELDSFPIFYFMYFYSVKVNDFEKRMEDERLRREEDE